MLSEDKVLRNIVRSLKQVFDPEIPVNIYDLGLIYNIDLDKDYKATIKMTLTAPGCPVADELIEQVNDAVLDAPGVTDVEINLVFEPEWDKDMMSEEAKLELGFL